VPVKTDAHCHRAPGQTVIGPAFVALKGLVQGRHELRHVVRWWSPRTDSGVYDTVIRPGHQRIDYLLRSRSWNKHH
jgi:hypothetical protein